MGMLATVINSLAFQDALIKCGMDARVMTALDMQKIAESFTIGKVYDETAVSDIIARFHPDYCTLRRDMISEGILTREKGNYVRVK